MEEIWKDIKGYEGLYQVSNLGRVKSLERKVRNGEHTYRIISEKILKLDNLYDGYLGIGLYISRKQHYFKVHRLVAESFIPNPENKLEVNHIDGNKTNNNAENLEWVTRIENMRHAAANNLIHYNYGFTVSEQTRLKLRQSCKNKRRILYVELNTEYPSIMECSRSTGVSHWRILNSLKEDRTILGTTFKYV